MKKKSLVNLVSLEKNACFQEMVAEKGLAGSGVWIGLNKIDQVNYTTWQSGAPLNYTDWDVNKPAAFASVHCVGA